VAFRRKASPTGGANKNTTQSGGVFIGNLLFEITIYRPFLSKGKMFRQNP
jgi:hypothetical protein